MDPTPTRTAHPAPFDAKQLPALASLVRVRARALLGDPAAVPAPSAGIYYVLRLSHGWQIYPYRYAEFPDEVDHSEFWEGVVAPALAKDCATSLGVTSTALERRLRLHTYGFPRGRVCVTPGEPGHYSVLHGRDLRPFMGVEPALIERLFGLTNPGVTANWEEDEHEHCQEDDRDAVRQVLRLTEDETWAAV